MSDQDLAAQVEQLRAWQEQTDQTLMALADAIETLIDQVEGHAVSDLTLSGALTSARLAATSVKQNHSINCGK